MIRSASDVGRLGTIVGIWAHPDDEAYLSAGLMAIARDAGQRVVCVTATRGERGTPDPVAWPPDRLAKVRTAEMAACLDVLGVEEHLWLDYVDGGCAALDHGGPVDRVAEVIDDVMPDTVLTFGPDGITGHADHRAVGAWAAAAVDRVAPGTRVLHATVGEEWLRRWRRLNAELGIYEPGYPVSTPDQALAVNLHLDDRTASRKAQALATQESQTAPLIELMGIERYTAWMATEAYVERPG